MENVRKLAKLAALNQKIPGPVCGNQDCEELCAEAYDAALSLRMDPVEVLRKTIQRELLCIPAEDRSGHACRFGFLPVSDSLALSGKMRKARKRKDEEEIIHIFRTGVNECKKCQALEGTRISPEIWADEEKMKSKGFWKQKNGKYLPHPNCKCHWETVFEMNKRKTQKNEKQKHLLGLLSVASNERNKSTSKINLAERGKHIPEAAATALETVYGPTGWGEAAGAVQAGTELMTNKGIIIGRITNALRNSYMQGHLSEDEYDRFSSELEKCKRDDNIKRTYILYNRLMQLLKKRGVDMSRYRFII